jgi:hypothetical protein
MNIKKRDNIKFFFSFFIIGFLINFENILNKKKVKLSEDAKSLWYLNYND